MALFARICVRVHSRVPAPTFPPPYTYGGMEMGGCAIGRAYMRMCMRMCMRERRERGRMDGGRGDFTCSMGYPQRPPPAAQWGCSPSLPGIFYLLQGISLFRCLLSRMRMRPPDYAPTFSPPHIWGGKWAYRRVCAGACAYAYACGWMFILMRFICPTPAPSPSPLPPRCGKM